ncbi:glutaredoxin family protein [Shewanella algidipiscicola]|uniref:glutaredoxin family protein n=1 Tax=Shewanella algidipiscicola TaxID=614070 RepID=UPI000D78C095|nr:glutaredoxin family protein [Shewanella algidipiscicola]
MPNRILFTLFHTDACHLCEQAQALIDTLGIDYVKQDICDSDELAQEYGTRIPVFLRADTQAQLNWPFDIPKLKQFIGA